MFLSQDYKREIVFIFVYKTFTFWNSDTCVSGGISLGKMIFPQKVSFVSDPPCTPSALEMIHFTGDIYEKLVPQHLLPFYLSKIFQFSRQKLVLR